MSDLLHWYARAHGPKAFRIMEAARSGELDDERADAAAEPELIADFASPQPAFDAST